MTMKRQLRDLKVWVMVGLLSLGGAWGQRAIAAETLRLKLGPLQQTLQLEDLETFAETGQVPQPPTLWGIFGW